MDRQHVNLLVMIDLSAAFDTIDHQILLHRLRNRFGIQGSALHWLESYLTHRSQSVMVNGIESSCIDMHFGVPQGSVLGPLLFTLYIAPLYDIIEKHLQLVSAYADDQSLYQHFIANIKDTSGALLHMEECLIEVRQWMHQNKLKMNDSKTEFILIGTPAQLSKLSQNSIIIGNEVIVAADCVKNLGVLIDKHLSMSSHVVSKCNAAFYQLYTIWQSRRFISQKATECLVHSLVFSHLDYCNSLLFGISKYLVAKMQSIQNFAARTVLRKLKYTRASLCTGKNKVK